MKITPEVPAQAEASDAIGQILSSNRSRASILIEVLNERDRQDEINGGANNDDATPVYKWAVYINHQLSRVQSGHGPWRKRLIRIAALALAALESIDRQASK